MKYLLWTLGVVAGLFMLFGILQYVASERVEVVRLITVDSGGEEQTTRLWIVDHEGLQYLRGSSGSGWVERLRQGGEFQLERGGETVRYNWRSRPDKIAEINRLMNEKYTWSDELIGLLPGDRSQSLAIELHPVSGVGPE